MNAVAGGVDRDRVKVADGQGADQPHTVLGVVGDSSVAGCAIGAAARAVLGQAGKVAVGPGDSAVKRGCVADVSAAAIRNAAYLKRGDDDRSIGEGVGLDFGLMLAAAIGKGILTELPE